MEAEGAARMNNGDHEYHIRIVRPDDAAALLSIYAPYVAGTAVSFEYDVPSEAEFRERIAATLRRYPYLAAERDGDM